MSMSVASLIDKRTFLFSLVADIRPNRGAPNDGYQEQLNTILHEKTLYRGLFALPAARTMCSCP